MWDITNRWLAVWVKEAGSYVMSFIARDKVHMCYNEDTSAHWLLSHSCRDERSPWSLGGRIYLVPRRSGARQPARCRLMSPFDVSGKANQRGGGGPKLSQTTNVNVSPQSTWGTWLVSWLLMGIELWHFIITPSKTPNHRIPLYLYVYLIYKKWCSITLHFPEGV